MKISGLEICHSAFFLENVRCEMQNKETLLNFKNGVFWNTGLVSLLRDRKAGQAVSDS